MAFVIEVSAICLFNAAGQVLTMRKAGTRGWMLVGGKPETGEDALTCVIREVDEELAITLDPTQIRFLGDFSSTAVNEGAPLLAHVFTTSQQVNPRIRGEIAAARWVDPANPGQDQAPLNTDLIFPLLVGTDD